jgi:hypothetical protein
MKYILSGLVFVVFVLASCNTIPKDSSASLPMSIKPGTSSTQLSSVTDNISDSAVDIKDSADTIIKEAENAKRSIDTVYDESTDKQPLDMALDSIQEIDSKADIVIRESIHIEEEVQKLVTLQKQVDSLEDEIISLNSAAEEAKKKALEKLYGYITFFWVIGFALIAAGAAIAFFVNKTFGGTISLVGILMIGFASAAQFYMEQIAMIGAILLGVSFVGGIAMIAWSAFKSKKSDTAIREIVEMIEILKETMTDDESRRIFGPEGVASKVQSDLTRKIINQIREKNGFLKLKEIKEAAKNAGPSS